MNTLTLSEQLAIVAESAHAEWQSSLMWMCLSALAAILLVISLYAARNFISRTLRMLIFLGPIGCALLIPGIVKLYVYGSTKPTPSHLWRFEYTNGVQDNGSYCTNNLICAAWTYNLAAMEYTLRAAYQDLTITNAQGQCVDTLHQLQDALVRDGSHVWEIANATNMRVVVYAQYVPPPAVHTNGIYKLNGVMPSMDETPGKYITPGIQIHVNLETGETRILTPTNRPPETQILKTLYQETLENGQQP